MLKGYIIVFYSGYLTGVGLNVMQIFIGKPTPPLGSIFMLIFIVGILYLMRKYRLMRLDYRLLENEAFDIISDIFIIVDPERFIMKANKTSYDILGIRENRISQQAADSIFPDTGWLQKNINEIETGEKKNEIFGAQFVDKSGKEIVANPTLLPIFDDFGDFIGTVIHAKILNEYEKIMNQYNRGVFTSRELIFVAGPARSHDIADITIHYFWHTMDRRFYHTHGS
jgi:transcriptional regulator with PAS, ATPase and Fis domain